MTRRLHMGKLLKASNTRFISCITSTICSKLQGISLLNAQKSNQLLKRKEARIRIQFTHTPKYLLLTSSRRLVTIICLRVLLLTQD